MCVFLSDLWVRWILYIWKLSCHYLVIYEYLILLLPDQFICLLQQKGFPMISPCMCSYRMSISDYNVSWKILNLEEKLNKVCYIFWIFIWNIYIIIIIILCVYIYMLIYIEYWSRNESWIINCIYYCWIITYIMYIFLLSIFFNIRRNIVTKKEDYHNLSAASGSIISQ